MSNKNRKSYEIVALTVIANTSYKNVQNCYQIVKITDKLEFLLYIYIYKSYIY